MSCDACKSGFKWEGSPTGTETTIAGNKAYVTGTSKDAAILIVHDIFGWTLRNARVLADEYAKGANATVYLPDFFDGDVVDPSNLDDPEKRAKFDIPGFLFPRHGKDARWPEIEAVAKALKSQYPKVGAIGFCYGGWAICRLGANPELIDAVSGAHPSLMEKSEIDNLKVPIQFIAPEEDAAFSPELKKYANEVIPTLGVPYEYIFFPGLAHGFATRGNPNDKKQKEGLERAKRSASHFFTEFLH